MKDQNTIDFILNDITGGKEPTDTQKAFMLDGYEKGSKFFVGESGGGTVFEVVENNLNTITLKPLGTNCICKEAWDFKTGTNTQTRIIDGKIVKEVIPL